MEKTIDERVMEIVVRKFGDRAKSITGETSFIDDLGMDSLDIGELMVAMEEEFHLDQISDRTIDSLATVGDAIAYVKKCTPE